MHTPVNHVHLMGTLTKEPQVTHKQNGEKLVRFALATREHLADSEGKTAQKSQWHKLVARNKWAHILEEFAEKGQQLAVEGTLRSTFFKLPSGKNYFSTEIEVTDLVLLGKTNQQIA